MIHDLKPYPVYKDSGVPWLGEVPEHWDLVPNRALLKLKKQVVGGHADEYTLLSLTKRGIIARDMENPEGKFPASFETYQIVESGDLIFCLFDIDETPRTVGLSSMSGMITGAYTRFVCPDKQTRQFLYLLYLSLDNGKLLKPLYSGLRKVITKSTFLSAKLALPPPYEQTSIGRFLGHADRRIQRYIRAKQKVIKLLEEQKQVIIHRAVTRGRDSEWRSLPVSAVLRPVKRVGFPEKTLLSLFRDYGVVPKDSRENKNADMRDLALCQLVEPDDVVMNKMKAWQGSIAVSSIEGIVSPDYMVLQFVHDQVVPKFFHYLLRSPGMVAEYRRHAYGVRPGQWRLMYPDFRRLHLSVPPVEKQAAIARLIDEAITNIDKAVMRPHREITLLREYRTRLIADVVTGKLDVREAAARLPDEAEEPDSLDKAEALSDIEQETEVMEE